MNMLCPYCYGRFEGEREHCPHCSRKLLPPVYGSTIHDPNSWDLSPSSGTYAQAKLIDEQARSFYERVRSYVDMGLAHPLQLPSTPPVTPIEPGDFGGLLIHDELTDFPKGHVMTTVQFGTFVVELHEHAAVLMTMDFEGQPVAFTIESHAEAQHLVDAAEAIRGMVNFKDAPGNTP